MSHELIDHTGDIGIVVRAPTLEALFAEAAGAMVSILVDVREARPSSAAEFPIPAADPAEELREFLGEILYRFSAERMVYETFTPLQGGIRAEGEPFSDERHVLRTELKAVTYHQLEVTREADGWKARVIFDV